MNTVTIILKNNGLYSWSIGLYKDGSILQEINDLDTEDLLPIIIDWCAFNKLNKQLTP